MKICRFSYNKIVLWGKVDGDSITALKDAPYKRIETTSRKIPLKKVKILPPSVPSKIVLVGLNYKDHAVELAMDIPREPVIFLKPATALCGHNGIIVYPAGVKRLDYEAELAFVIKREARNISAKDAEKYILGYTCLNDVTARDIQKKDGQWTRAKSFDSFCPVGPWIQTAFDPSGVRVRLYLNGVLKQDSTTADFIFGVPRLLSFISMAMTLLPGDIVSTGTPAGVGPMKKGDVVEVEVEGIGRLKNMVE